MKLSNNEKEIIQNSLWVVNSALKSLKLDKDSDLRQDCILYMCRCLKRYDKSKGVKWTTYAYKCVSMYATRENARKKVSDSHLVLSGGTVGEDIPIDNDPADHFVQDFLTVLSSQLTDFEKQVLALKVKGFYLKEIAEQLNTPRHIVSESIHIIRTLATELRELWTHPKPPV